MSGSGCLTVITSVGSPHEGQVEGKLGFSSGFPATPTTFGIIFPDFNTITSVPMPIFFLRMKPIL